MNRLSMSLPMFKAIIEGRKTQTRRPVKDTDKPRYTPGEVVCLSEWHRITHDQSTHVVQVEYKDGHKVKRLPPLTNEYMAWWKRLSRKTYDFEKWRPPMYMPVWAARYDVRITGVEVQPLHDITDEEAMAEGIQELHDGASPIEGLLMPGQEFNYFRYGVPSLPSATYAKSPARAFSYLWDSIYKANTWAENPWVFVYTFEPVGERQNHMIQDDDQ